MRISLRANLQSPDRLDQPEKMSPGLERFYRRTVARFSAHPMASAGESQVVIPKLKTRVILDGQEYGNADEMPPAYRQFYEAILAQALPLNAAIYTVARTDHANFIKRAVFLAILAASVAATIVCLWLHGFYN